MYGPASLIATGFVLPILGGIAITMRLLSRRVNNAPIMIDDYLAIIAQLVLVGMGVVQLWATFTGDLGRNTLVSPQGVPIITDGVRVVLQAQYIEECIEKLGYGATKLSILFFYRRIFQVKRAFNIVSWILIALCVILTIGYTFSVVFQCRNNLAVSWKFVTLTQLDTQCVNTVDILITFCVFDVVLDLAILSQPIPIILGLTISNRRKATLLAIFLLGTLSIAAGLVRLGITVYETNHAYDPVTLNLTYVITPPMLWSLVEVATAVIAACLPTLGPLVTHTQEMISKNYARHRSTQLTDAESDSAFNIHSMPSRESTPHTRLVPSKTGASESYAMNVLA